MPLFGRRHPTPVLHHEYDGQQSVMEVKAAAQHIFQAVADECNQYIKDRIVPAHEAHPTVTFAIGILFVALILRMYCRTIRNLLVVGLLLAALHGWVSGHF